MIAAVIFDLDDTLFDHRRAADAGVCDWLSQLGYTVGAGTVERWFEAEAMHFPDFVAGRIDFAEQRRRRVRDMLAHVGHAHLDPAGLDAMFADYLASYRAAWSAFDDVHDCVADLARRGVAVAVLTNCPHDQAHGKMRAIGLDTQIPGVFSGESIGVAKPHPDAFLAVCHALDLPADRCVLVGDNHPIDIIGARAAGLQAIHLDRAGRAHPEDGRRINSLRQLLGVLDGM